VSESKQGRAHASAVPASQGAPAREPPGRALLVGLDAANAALARHWLAEAGWEIRCDDETGEPHGLVVFESRHPRRDAVDATLRALRGERDVPVLLISPTILPGTPPVGVLARELGVAAVLPVPLDRAGFVDLCGRLAGRSHRREGRC
jgi:hypothetical protein